MFLFLIYLFLTFISPQEVSYMLDNNQLMIDYFSKNIPFFKTSFKILIIILLSNLLLLHHKYNTLFSIFTVFIGIILITVLIDDFLQFYSFNGIYSAKN